MGNRKSVPQDYLLLEGPRFHLVNSDLGKDSADTWLVMLGSRELCLRRSVKKIAILSNDRDFAPLAYLAAERKKKLIIYAANHVGTESLRQAIKRTEAGEAASVEVIELDKLVGRQLEQPHENLRTKLLTGARNIIKFPQRLWKKNEEEPVLPSPQVMEPHELVLAILLRRARTLKGGKVIGAIAIVLLMLPNVLLQILLWVLYLALYVWPEKENAPVLA